MTTNKQSADRRKIFEEYPVKKAVLTLALPAVFNQLITTIYNLVDTFFIGKTNNSNMVGAVALGATMMILINCIGSLFSMGGGSLISRCLGAYDRDRAKKVSAFCGLTSILLSTLFGFVIFLNLEGFCYMVGASANNIEYTKQYVFYTMCIGALPTAFAMTIGGQLRAEGNAKHEMIGMVSGHLFNCVFDPILIFGFKLNVAGAAIATLASNVIASGYYIYYIRKTRKTSVINFSFSNYKIDLKTFSDILFVGLPAALNSLINGTSRMVLNNLLKSFGDTYIAAMGIVRRIDELPMHVASGFTQGTMSLIGYNYAGKNYSRMESIRKYSIKITLSISIVAMVLMEIFAPYIILIFINDSEVIAIGTVFLRILTFCLPIMTTNFALRSVFQAIGKGPMALLVSVLRQGVVYIPVMLIMSRFGNANLIAGAQILADSISLAIAYLMYLPIKKSILAVEAQAEEAAKTAEI